MDRSTGSGSYRFGPYFLDVDERVLRKDGQEVELSPTLMTILLALIENRGRIVTKEALIERVWPDRFVEEGNLARNVSFLRKSLDDDVREPKFIQTIPRRGYRFVGDVRLGDRQRLHAPTIGVWPRRLTRRSLIALGSLSGLAAVDRFFRIQTEAKAIRSLVVLPLQNFSNDEQGDVFAGGMTDALISDLGRIRALKVISRTTAGKYKQTSKTLPEIARELGVEAVAEGSVLRAGNRIRITVRLIEAATDQEVWSETHEEELVDTLALQRRVARAIARRIQVDILPDEEQRLEQAARSVDPEAHGHYLRGLFLRNKQTSAGFSEAMVCFEKAIAKDPEFAPAYAELAELFLLRGSFLGPAIELWPIARRYAERALAIDDALAEARVVKASLTLCFDFHQTVARTEFERCLQLNPGNPTALHRYGYALASMGLFDDAVARAMRAVELDPLFSVHHAMLGQILYFTGRYQEARHRLESAIEVMPAALWLRSILGLVEIQTGELGKAIEHLERAVAQGGGRGIAEELAYAYAVAGREREAQAKAEELVLSERHPGEACFGQAMIRAGLGDEEGALFWFERACRGWDYRLAVANVDPVWRTLRPNPIFPRLTAELGLQPIPKPAAS